MRKYIIALAAVLSLGMLGGCANVSNQEIIIPEDARIYYTNGIIEKIVDNNVLVSANDNLYEIEATEASDLKEGAHVKLEMYNNETEEITDDCIFDIWED